MPKTSVLKGKYCLPKDLARWADRSPRTIREYCKQGRIPEAVRTPGKHWRIKRPLSGKTRLLLKLDRPERLFPGWKGETPQREFDFERAEILMTAQVLACNLDDVVSDPVLAYRYPERQKLIAQIPKAIWDRWKKVKGFHDLPLIEGIYRFWRSQHRTPTKGEVAKVMRLSRSTFYRSGYHRIFDEAVYAVTGKTKRELPNADSLTKAESSDSASRDLEKPNFLSIQDELARKK